MSSPNLPGSYEDLFRQAEAHAAAGNTQVALDVYARLTEKLGRLSEAILARRPELRNMHRHANLQMAEILQVEGRYAEAIEIEEGLLKAYPEQGNVWRRDLAILRVQKGEVDRGLAELQTLTAETPDDVWNWILLGKEARIEGRYAESEAALERALEAAARADNAQLTAEARYGLFLLLNAMGRLDEAVAAWESAVAAEPTGKRTIREVYTMLTNAGLYRQAQEYVERDENALQAGLQRGLLAELTGDPDKAKNEWQAVAALDPMAFEQGQECWVEAVLRLGNPDPALGRMQQLLAQRGSVRLIILAGIGRAMRGDREPAQRLFEQSLALLRRSRPAKQKLDRADWLLLHSLVKDEELKAALKPYFAVIETVWG